MGSPVWGAWYGGPAMGSLAWGAWYGGPGMGGLESGAWNGRPGIVGNVPNPAPFSHARVYLAGIAKSRDCWHSLNFWNLANLVPRVLSLTSWSKREDPGNEVGIWPANYNR